MIHLLENFRHINRDQALRIFKEGIADLTTDLSVKIENVDLDNRGWISADFSGIDSDVLTEILKRNYGVASTDITKLEKGTITRGVIVDSTVGYGMYVDICLKSSNQTDALYPLHAMRSQLADGTKLSVRQISKRFCLQESFPLEVRVTNVNVNSGKIDVELSDKQVSYFKDWNRFPFDRVVLMGCSKNDLKKAIDLAGLRRDLADIESLSLTVHVLLCKLGTEAPGVISGIGRHLKGARAYAFLPRSRQREGYTTVPET
jgi:hypothetical protein